ncbi:MAG: hypothetical protein AB8G77_04705 [Rhodothermales bacterium]
MTQAKKEAHAKKLQHKKYPEILEDDNDFRRFISGCGFFIIAILFSVGAWYLIIFMINFFAN